MGLVKKKKGTSLGTIKHPLRESDLALLATESHVPFTEEDALIYSNIGYVVLNYRDYGYLAKNYCWAQGTIVKSLNLGMYGLSSLTGVGLADGLFLYGYKQTDKNNYAVKLQGTGNHVAEVFYNTRDLVGGYIMFVNESYVIYRNSTTSVTVWNIKTGVMLASYAVHEYTCGNVYRLTENEFLLYGNNSTVIPAVITIKNGQPSIVIAKTSFYANVLLNYVKKIRGGIL